MLNFFSLAVQVASVSRQTKCVISMLIAQISRTRQSVQQRVTLRKTCACGQTRRLVTNMTGPVTKAAPLLLTLDPLPTTPATLQLVRPISVINISRNLFFFSDQMHNSKKSAVLHAEPDRVAICNKDFCMIQFTWTA